MIIVMLIIVVVIMIRMIVMIMMTVLAEKQRISRFLSRHKILQHGALKT